MSQTVIPQLRITSAASSLAFYVDGLGFAVDWKHQFGPGYPWFFQLTREVSPTGTLEPVDDRHNGATA